MTEEFGTREVSVIEMVRDKTAMSFMNNNLVSVSRYDLTCFDARNNRNLRLLFIKVKRVELSTFMRSWLKKRKLRISANQKFL